MEVVHGQVVDVKPGKIIIEAPYDNWERYAQRQYEAVEIGLLDGRTISPQQRRKAYALLGEIEEWSGLSLEQVKLSTKRDFVEEHLDGLRKSLFSLSDCDMTCARDYITYLVDFVIEFGVPCHVPLYELCEDVEKYVYACCTHRVCAVCGKPAELHHVDRVGMGNNRDRMEHVGMQCLPLCMEHHMEAHNHGDEALMAKYHLCSVPINEKIAKANKLRRNKHAENAADWKLDS